MQSILKSINKIFYILFFIQIQCESHISIWVDIVQALNNPCYEWPLYWITQYYTTVFHKLSYIPSERK